MASPILSVIIPTYHRNDLLALCLSKLAPTSQTLSSDLYEVIVSDDGKRSNAQSMLEKEFAWVKWVQGPRNGPAANRNNGAKNASAKWLVFVDDDCLPDKDWLKAFSLKIPLQNKNVVLEGKTICNEKILGPLMHSPVNLYGGYLWSCNMSISKQLFTQLKGFDEAFPYPHMEDVDFKERILSGGFDIQFVENAIVNHPPRKYPTFKKLAVTHESEVYYFFKNKRNLSLPNLLNMVFQARIRKMWKWLFHHDTPEFILSTFYEFIFIFFNFHKWHSKYSNSK